jgi:hypothetical protein
MKTKNLFLFAVVFLTISFSSIAQTEPPKTGRYYEREVVKAYRNKDFKGYLENLKKALALSPNHPRILYNIAGASADDEAFERQPCVVKIASTVLRGGVMATSPCYPTTVRIFF